MKIGIENNGIFIGSMSFPDRKKPCLVVERDNMCVVIGTFKDDLCVDYFGEALEELLRIKREEE